MSDKEVRIRITGDVSDLQKKLKSIEDSLNNLGKNGTGNNKFVNSLIDDISKAEKGIDELGTTLDDMGDSFRKLGKNSYLDELAHDMSDMSDESDEVADSIRDIGKSINSIDDKAMSNISMYMDEMYETGERVYQVFDDISDTIGGFNAAEFDYDFFDFGDTNKAVSKVDKATDGLIDNIASGFTSGVVASNVMAKSFEGITTEIKDVMTALKELDAFTPLKDKVRAFDDFADTITRTRDHIDKLREAYNDLDREYDKIYNDMSRIEAELDGYGDVADDAEWMGLQQDLQKVAREMEEYQGLIDKAEGKLKELTKEEGKYVDEISNKIDRYEELGEKIEKIMNDENENILVQRRLAQAYDQTTKSMSDMCEYVEYDKVSKDLERLTKDAREYVEATSLMNFDTLGEDIKKLTKHIDEKIEKTKELTAANNAMDDQTKSTVYRLEAEAEALRDYADSAGYAFKWIKEKAGTDEEWQVVGNIKALEKAMNPAKVKEYNEAITEYFHIINETNGQISKSFLNEDGSFSAAKFIAILERFGRPASMLAAEYKNVKNKTLEYLKVGDQENKQLAKTAKARLESIATIKKEAQALKEKSETQEKDAKKQLEALTTQKQSVDAKLEEIEAAVKLGKALQEKGEATDEDNRKLKENIELLKEYQQMSNKLAQGIVEADNKAAKAKQDLLEATEKLTKAKKDEARAQEILDRYDRETKINNAKKKLEEAEESQKSAKAKLDEAKAAKKAVEEILELYQTRKKLMALRETGDMNATADESSTKKFIAATEKAEKAQRKYNDTLEKTKKAQEEYEKSTREVAEAKERLETAERSEIDNKRKHVEAVNEQAKALKKYGEAIEKINLDEIRNIDKSLGTKLKNLFPNDLPKSAEQFKEYIKSAFSELNDLDLGNFGGLLKDIGGGLLKNVLAKIPGWAKAAAVAVAALGVALKKCADAGVAQFNKGVNTLKTSFSKIKSLAMSFGRETITAFESITGTHIDLSSLMELGPNFEHQMQRVGAIAGSNSEQLGRLSDKAKELGGTTQFTASQVGQAFEYMAMAGYNTEEMIDSIQGVIDLSIASGTDLAKTSDIVTDYMTAMGMAANQTGDFVDKLSATVTSSNTNVEQYGMAMKQVASQAGSLGVTLTDLSTAIGLQANAGVKGSKAGTALKNILTNMASPTEKQAKALKELGFEANKTGGYFKLTADDAVDLEATVKQLMTSTEGMTRAQKAATLAQFAGREALPGLMALLSQGAEGWDELSTTIENSTSKIQYWNECMSLAGKKGDEATKLIDNMKTVFAETEMEATALGLSTEDLSHAIALLGDDGKVSTKNVQDLLDVIESMNTATGESEEKWRALDGAFNDTVNNAFDYDATIAKLTADTQGLSQATKDQITEQLKNVDTYEEANAILQKYGLTAERVSFESLSFAEKLDYLRGNLKGTSDEYIRQQLANLGLAESYDEVKEVLDMTEDEFQAYAKNLETVRTMTERLKEAMDSTTKASLLELASAIENVCIAAFEKLKPVLQSTSNALIEFFKTWHNDTQNVFTFDGFEKGLAGLAKKIEGQKGNIENAIAGLFSNINRFVNKGSLDSILKMGTDIVNSIAQGINKAKSDGTLDAAISGAIRSIGTWCSENLDTIVAVGKEIIDSISRGIEENSDVIGDVIKSVIDMQTTIDGAVAFEKGRIFGENFGTFIGKGIESKLTEWVASFGGFLSGLFPSNFTMEGEDGQEMMYIPDYTGMTGGTWVETGRTVGKEIGNGINQGAKEEIVNNKALVSDAVNDNFQEAKVKTGITSSEIGQEVSDNIMSKLETMDASQLAALGTELTNLQTTVEGVATGIGTSFTNIQNASRTSFMGLTNIIRNQMVNCTNIVRNQAVNMSNIFRNQFVNMANIARNQFVNLANIVRNQMVNAANIVRNQAVNMANIFRNQFTSMSNVARNQMVNVSNIIRNQSVSWSNIIRNQVTNARNAFTSQMISMASVARTQMVNVSNIVRNQAISWSNVVRNQSANMKSAFSTAFSGLAGVAARGMAACLSTVRSYMSQIRAATSQTMTMNFKVNKTMTTTNVTKNVVQGLNNTMGNIARSSASLIAPQAVSIGGSIGTNRTVSGLGSVESLQLSVPLTVDGREIARASAKYNQEELAKLSKRNNRRRGE